MMTMGSLFDGIGGFPLAGERSGLFMEQVRIVKEMRNADENQGLPNHLVRKAVQHFVPAAEIMAEAVKIWWQCHKKMWQIVG